MDKKKSKVFKYFEQIVEIKEDVIEVINELIKRVHFKYIMFCSIVCILHF